MTLRYSGEAASEPLYPPNSTHTHTCTHWKWGNASQTQIVIMGGLERMSLRLLVPFPPSPDTPSPFFFPRGLAEGQTDNTHNPAIFPLKLNVQLHFIRLTSATYSLYSYLAAGFNFKSGLLSIFVPDIAINVITFVHIFRI